MFISGGTSNRKLELSVAGASDLNARVQKLMARKLRADDILIATHASDLHVWPSDSQNSPICTSFLKSPCQMRITPLSGAPILNAAVHHMYALHVPAYAETQFCFKSFA